MHGTRIIDPGARGTVFFMDITCVMNEGGWGVGSPHITPPQPTRLMLTPGPPPYPCPPTSLPYTLEGFSNFLWIVYRYQQITHE